MPNVTKRDGRTEEFIPEKIVVSVIKVGAPADVARQIAKDIQSKVKEKISTAEIRENSFGGSPKKETTVGTRLAYL